MKTVKTALSILLLLLASSAYATQSGGVLATTESLTIVESPAPASFLVTFTISSNNGPCPSPPVSTFTVTADGSQVGSVLNSPSPGGFVSETFNTPAAKVIRVGVFPKPGPGPACYGVSWQIDK